MKPACRIGDANEKDAGQEQSAANGHCS